MSKTGALPKDVADKYNLKDITAGNFYFPGFGEIDLTSISVDRADQLHDRKFPHLTLKKKRQADPPAI